MSEHAGGGVLRRLYDWTMAKASHRHAQWWLAAFAFMEASFFPIPPHPMLGLMCLAEPKKGVRFAAVATAGSVLGGLLGYAIGHFAFAAFGEALLRLLHLEQSFPTAACYLREYGAEIIIVKGATPIPFKLLTITAGFIGMNLGVFFVASVISRSISFMIVGVAFRLFGAPIKAVIDKHLGKVTLGFVVLIVAGFLAISLVGGGAKKTDAACKEAPASVRA
ncbi:DedA family protein [Novosphingobium profundi]|uniref:YqaA family protein n=1 Tax=Novosphingobium profundi TaxID=1774954 RepID=UPI001BD9FEE3|nr:YqaA family protein [Novosphingobium profundi]MBT0667784.1 DedA family protein [Novosphingobium profundi]